MEVQQPLRRDRERIFADAPLPLPPPKKSPRLGQNLPPSGVTASKMEPKAAVPMVPPSPEASAHMLGTTMPGSKAESPHEPPALAKAEAEAVPEMTKVDVDDDAKVDEDDPLVKKTSEFQSLRGEEPQLKEQKARFCTGCDAELSLGSLACSFCDKSPTGAKSSVGADTAANLIQVLAPIKKK